MFFREVEAYLRCGILANGFTRLRCEGVQAGAAELPFSCKKRVILSPSCGWHKSVYERGGRPLGGLRVLNPKCPIRQWVISFPFSVRYALAYKPQLVTGVLSIFIRIVSKLDR